MNPFTLLKEDHKKVKELFKEWEGLGERAVQGRKTLSEKIFEELEIHTSIEEEIFYSALQESGEKEAQELVNEAFEEHALVKELIEEMRLLEGDDETFIAKFKVMRENVEHHIEEEEHELFPVAKKALSEESDEIGDEMQERKVELQSSAGSKKHKPEHGSGRRV